MKAIPENLKRWEHPDSYMGATWEDWYVFIGQHRDSDALTRSNFRCAVKAMEAIPTPEDWPHEEPPWQTVSENHWAFGWVEWIAIHKDASAHVKEADEIAGALSDYPVVDESDFSELETEEGNRVWKNCYDPHERVDYIRRNRSQFDFQDWRDLRAVVNGEYFNGYASELIS